MHNMAEQENRNSPAVRIAAMFVAFVMTAAVALAAGCAPASSSGSAADESKKAAEYMVSLNKHAEDLSASLTEFAAAVADDDVTSMQVKADAAYGIIDEMNGLEAPDDLKDVHEKYNEATESLKTALGDYIALYVEISNSMNGQFDYNKYESAIEGVQKEYDEGIKQLEAADEMASNL